MIVSRTSLGSAPARPSASRISRVASACCWTSSTRRSGPDPSPAPSIGCSSIAPSLALPVFECAPPAGGVQRGSADVWTPLPRLLDMWLLLDLVLVAVFAVIGRLSHHGTLTAGGWWTTAWPFLAGTLLAWAALVVVRRPPEAVVSGVVVWLGALVVGMVLRRAGGQGTATAFVVVATLVLGALLVLPRVGARVRRRSPSARCRAPVRRPRRCDRPRLGQPPSGRLVAGAGPRGGARRPGDERRRRGCDDRPAGTLLRRGRGARGRLRPPGRDDRGHRDRARRRRGRPAPARHHGHRAALPPADRPRAVRHGRRQRAGPGVDQGARPRRRADDRLRHRPRRRRTVAGS